MNSLNKQGLVQGIQSLNEILRTCNLMENAAEAKMSVAENELNAVRKLRGFAEIQLANYRRKLQEME